MGIEPTPSAWKAEVLPLNYTRTNQNLPYWRLRQAECHKKAWWRGEDSNLRRQSRQIYSLIPLTAREPLPRLAAHCAAWVFLCQASLSSGAGPRHLRERTISLTNNADSALSAP